MRNEDLLNVLSIGLDTSSRGVGLSLKEALERAQYAELRPEIRVEDVIAALQNDPELISQWINYCEDKRTNGGWYILSQKREIGCITDRSTAAVFDTIEEAVAYFLLHELDYWSDFSDV